MNWYCIQAKPQKEEFAARYCTDVLGLEAYFPKLKERRIIRRVKRTVLRPLFPSYLFCRLDQTTHYRAVRYAPDVIDVVQFGDAPTPVADEVIHELKSWTANGVEATDMEPPLLPGNVVRITGGVMQGLNAVILHEMDDRERVAVLLSILNCGARMIVDRPHLERVG